MNTIYEGREKLKMALLEVSARETEALELAPEEEVYYSSKLTKKMSGLLRFRSKSYWGLVNSAAKRAVAACLVIAAITGALMGCKPVRKAVVNFFQNVYEAYTEFVFDKKVAANAPNEIEDIRVPTYIPEGYELTDKAETSSYLMYLWKNEFGNIIYFHQMTLNGKNVLDTENATVEWLEGTDILLVEKENRIQTFWNDEDYAYTLTAYDLSKDEILNVIKSVKCYA